MRPDAIDWGDRTDHVTLAFLPRQRFRAVLWRWLRRLIAGQAIAAVLVVVLLQGPWRSRSGDVHARTVTEFAAARLDGVDASGDALATRALLGEIAAAPSIDYVAIVDPTNRVIAAAGATAADVDAERESLGGQWPTSLDDTPRVKSLDERLVLAAPFHAADPAQDVRLVVGVSDTAARRAVVDAAIAIAIGGGVVSIVLAPIAGIRFRRWAVGLHKLHEAIRRMSTGAPPQPLPVGGEDEIAYLLAAFNDMTGKLIASHERLRALNAELEQRVERRTHELKAANERLEELASHDMLTGLANRRYLMDRMHGMFHKAVRESADLACLAIDLDGFKGVNDTLGHAAGDELLVLAAEVFGDVCRPYDLAARLGGDEFVVLVPTPDGSGAAAVADRLLRTFDERCAARFDDRGVERPSMSIGIALRKSCGAVEEEALLRAADEALYAAKEAGKARAVEWSTIERKAA